MTISTLGAKLTSGQHAGKYITRVSVRYLISCIKNKAKHRVKLANGNHIKLSEAASCELVRRGAVEHKAAISAHAINRLSCDYLDVYLENREPGEGLYTWAAKIVEGFNYKFKNVGVSRATFTTLKLRWVVQFGDVPVLITITPTKGLHKQLHKRKRG